MTVPLEITASAAVFVEEDRADFLVSGGCETSRCHRQEEIHMTQSMVLLPKRLYGGQQIWRPER